MADNEYISEMIIALQANIQYLKKQGTNNLTLKNGALIEKAAEFFIYEFELDFFQNVDEDAEIEVRVGSLSSNGKIISVSEKSIRVQLDANLGASIHQARLIISNYYLLELLTEKLKKLHSGEDKQTDLVYRAFGIEKSDNKYYHEVIPTLSKQILDKYKEKALALSLGSDVTYIWGPPGTGKTQLIARIIEAFLYLGKSTLLLSHTNVATDGALERTIELIASTDDYQDGKIIRIGHSKAVSEKLKDKYKLVLVENIIEMKIRPLKEELQRLMEEQLSYTNTVEENKKILSKFEEHEELINELKIIKNGVNDNYERLNSFHQQIDNNQKKIQDIERKIKRYQSANIVSRLFLGYSLDILTYEKSTTLQHTDKIERQIEIVNAENDTLKKKIILFEHKKNQLEAHINKHDCKKLKQDLAELQLKIKNISKQIIAIQKQIEEISEDIIKQAKVVGTTLTKSYSSKSVISRDYDCVIIDEASMAPLPALWCATGLAKEKVVIVGDFFQLPPIAKHQALKDKSKTENEFQREQNLVDKWLKNDIYKITGIQEAIKARQVPLLLQQLKMQYRMHPDIAEVINYLVYSKYSPEYALESARNTNDKGIDLLSKEPLSNFHIGIYDTSCIGAIPSITDSGSYYNLYHALIAVHLAEQALENGYENIGIITPFRAQINLIQKILKDKNLHEKITADTVHRFQGEEEQLIIFDLVTDKPTKLTDDNNEGGDDEKLLNVAFSRSKEKCILLADISKTLKYHSPTSQIKKFIELVQRKKYPIIPTDAIYPRYEVTQESETWLRKIGNIDLIAEEIRKSELFDQNDFYPQLLKDMLSAKHEIIIDSPFITENRVNQLIPYFQTLRNKNIKIFIITRIPKDHNSLMHYQAVQILKQFEELGIVVLPFYGYPHRKLAIIDRQILWEGSLNILSQKESQEFMRRFHGSETSEEMIRFLNIDKNIGKKAGDNLLVHCEFCTSSGSWYWIERSKYGGYWTCCLTGRHSVGKPPITNIEREKKKIESQKLRKMKKERTENGTPLCPVHNIPMIQKDGRFGPFWGCENYPRCKVTEKLKK